MPIGMLFWILWVLWLLGWVGVWQARDRFPWAPHAHNLLLLILLFLLGWGQFGFVIHA